MSTCTSPSAPRSTSIMRCAEKSRRRRFNRPSASPSGAGSRWMAMSASACTLSSGASHPGPTGCPGSRCSAWPQTTLSPYTACSRYSDHVIAVLPSNPSVITSASAPPLRRCALTPSAVRRSHACVHVESSAVGVCAARTTKTLRVCRSPSRIWSAQYRCIASSRRACGPATGADAGSASRRTRISSCIGRSSVWHIRANAAAAAALRAGSSESMSRSLVASTAENRPPRSHRSSRITTGSSNGARGRPALGMAPMVRRAMRNAAHCRRGARGAGAQSPPDPIRRVRQDDVCSRP